MIAYVKQDGSIFAGCSADSVNILSTITKIPNGCVAIYIDDIQYPDVWGNQGEYTIQNGVPVYTPIPDDTKLKQAIKAKEAELEAAYDNANPTFQSSALGTVHTYLSDEKAMNKFNAEYAYVNGPAYGGESIPWFTLEEGGVLHTKEQFNQVWLEGRKIFADAFNNWDSKVKQARAVTITTTLQDALDQLNTITW